MLVEAAIWTVAKTDHGNAVLIKPLGLEVTVPIFIGQLEAQAILICLGNVHMPRPLTHDLLRSVLTQLGCKLLRVEIISLTGGTFYAQLIVQKGEETIIIDSRPSDSIALSVREKCPILIEESVIETAGIPVEAVSGDIENPFQYSEAMMRDSLLGLLDEAIASENYEEAARIRDKIKDLEKKSNQGR